MEYVSVVGLAFFEFWLAYPVAYAMKIDWVPATILIAGSSSLGAVLTIYLGGRFRERMSRRIGREGRIARRTKSFMDRWGTVGIGLLSPWILGPILTSVGAIVLGANLRQLASWIVFGIWVWAIGLYLCIRFTGGMGWLLMA